MIHKLQSTSHLYHFHYTTVSTFIFGNKHATIFPAAVEAVIQPLVWCDNPHDYATVCTQIIFYRVVIKFVGLHTIKYQLRTKGFA